MLIIGAGGFAKQLLDVALQNESEESLFLFDDLTKPAIKLLYDKFPVIHTVDEAEHLFKKGDRRFVIGVGKPQHRAMLYDKFMKLGGVPFTLVSKHAVISSIACKINDGVNVLTGAIIENGTTIGKGALINIGSFVTHDCTIGEFTEICPGVRMSGNCHVGSYTSVGTGSIIIPRVKVGNNVVVAAGSVITKDIPDNVMVAGVPAEIKKEISL